MLEVLLVLGAADGHGLPRLPVVLGDVLEGGKAVLEAVAGSVDRDDVAVVQQPVEITAPRTSSPKTWPHSPKLLFEVSKVEPFSYRFEITWKTRFASARSRG